MFFCPEDILQKYIFVLQLRQRFVSLGYLFQQEFQHFMSQLLLLHLRLDCSVVQQHRHKELFNSGSKILDLYIYGYLDSYKQLEVTISKCHYCLHYTDQSACWMPDMIYLRILYIQLISGFKECSKDLSKSYNLLYIKHYLQHIVGVY